MNEKLEYAKMIDSTENTFNITYKPIKKRRLKKKSDLDLVKRQVIDKVNSSVENVYEEQNIEENIAIEENNVTIKKVQGRKKTGAKSVVVSVQLAVIGALIATIFLTNAFNANSGINTFFRQMFEPSPVVSTDNRTFSDFVPTLATNTHTVSDGVIAVSGEGSVYATLDGKVKNVNFDAETGKYSVEIYHSDNFSSVYSGLDYFYGAVHGTVYKTMPLGYSLGEMEVCFMNMGEMITNYQIVDDSVVWEV